MTRPIADIQDDLAAVASEFARWESRRAHLHGELAAALRATPAEAPARPASELPDNMTTAQAAAFLGVSQRHLKAMRAEGRGPIPFRVGRAVRYPTIDVQVYAERNAVRSPSSAPSHNRSGLPIG